MQIQPRLPRLPCLILAVGLSTNPAMADERGEIDACLDGADRPANCIGITVSACVARPGGDTTVGMVDCIGAETAAWDAILNEEYASTMEDFRDRDASGDVAAPDMTRVGTLREAQRAWIAFRDAECRAQYAIWGGGTLRQVVGANCVLTETAERAVELRQMRAP